MRDSESKLSSLRLRKPVIKLFFITAVHDEFLTVLQTVVLEVGVVMGVDTLSIDVGVVMYHQDEVGSDVYIELASPEMVLLCHFEGFDGILGEACFLAVPVTPVSCDGYLV